MLKEKITGLIQELGHPFWNKQLFGINAVWNNGECAAFAKLNLGKAAFRFLKKDKSEIDNAEIEYSKKQNTFFFS